MAIFGILNIRVRLLVLLRIIHPVKINYVETTGGTKSPHALIPPGDFVLVTLEFYLETIPGFSIPPPGSTLGLAGSGGTSPTLLSPR